jgi:hypothetical protein
MLKLSINLHTFKFTTIKIAYLYSSPTSIINDAKACNKNNHRPHNFTH